MRILYEIFLSIYLLGIKSSALFGNAKAKKWIEGRKNVFAELGRHQVKPSSKLAWFHAASLGEYEMGKPLMEKLRRAHGFEILVTFFSPSGYEHRRENEITELVFYLPFDRKKDVSRFLDMVNPQMVFFIKNEFWMNLLLELKERKISTYLISGLFRVNHPFFQYYGGFFRKGLRAFDHLFVQNDSSQKLLKKFNFNQVSVAGDMRIDRTFENAKNAPTIECLESFSKNQPVVILGSSWEKEESYIARYIEKYPGKIKVIIAPHDVSSNRLTDIQNEFRDGVLFSEFEKDSSINTDVLIVDSIGKLMSIYKYGDVAFVGGAWGSGLHNILEPAAFGLPLIFGPLIHKFPEAFELIEAGAAYSVDKYKDFETTLTKLVVDSSSGNELGSKAKDYIASRIGVTDKILAQLDL